MSYKEIQDELEQQRRDTEQAASEEEVITNFLRLHIKELAPVQANRHHIVRYFNGDEVTHQALADSFEHHPAFRAGFAWQTEANARERIESQIVALLVGSDSAIAHERAKIRFKTTEELQARLEELTRRAEIQKLPKDELRKLTAPERPSRFQPVEPLYQNPDILKAASPAEIRRLIRVSGLDAVNAILSKKSGR
jgi:hypothetical protein